MAPKHNKTLGQVFKNPVPTNIKWRDIETMLISLGAEVKERNGSRVRFTIQNVQIMLHRPHPRPETKAYVIKNVRAFLIEAKIVDENGKQLD